MKTIPPLPYSTSTSTPVHRPLEPLDPGTVDQLRQAVQLLLAEAATFDVNSPISALTRWRATALVIIQSLCTPDDIAWQVLRLEAPWSLTDTAEAGVRERELAHRYLKDGDLAGARWAIKRGYQALPGGLQQFRTAADGVTDPYSEADGLRHLADQLKHTPAPVPQAHQQSLLG